MLPVLICPVPRATDKSAIVVSSVSPLLCETTAVQFASLAIKMASIVSLKLPI
jgi:hypothetical protein